MGEPGEPSRKKQKQVLLGAWLTRAGEGPSVDPARNGHSRSSPPPNTVATSLNTGEGAGGAGGGSGRKWASYEPAHGGRRPDTNARPAASATGRPPAAATYSYVNDGYNKSRSATVVCPPVPRPGDSAGVASSLRGLAATAQGREEVRSGEEQARAGAGTDTGHEASPTEGLEEIMVGLSDEQRLVLRLVLEGKSIFFTGAAGTGKSFLLKKLQQALQLSGKGPGTFLTGTTGKAAVGIGGCTIHSFAGIGLGNQPVEDLLGRVQRSRQAKRRWADCRVLVIDEVSMMDGDLFDKLNLVAQRMKGSSQPFGGIQLILCGDFFQLPPVGIGRGSTRFCFEARTWDTSIDQSIVLKQVFRQRDPAFLHILHEMREGRVGEEARRMLVAKVSEARERQRVTPDPCEGGGESAPLVESGDGDGGVGGVPMGRGGGEASGEDERPCEQGRRGAGAAKSVTYTRLFSKNEDVDRLNYAELRRLKGEALTFQAMDSGDPAYLKQLQAHCAAPETLEIKVGAKVLLLKNVDSSSQLVNGATGVVREFIEASGRRLPKVEFDAFEGYDPVVTVIREEEWTVSLAEREMARRVQLPLRLAWALSVHKSQGMTIANVMVSTQGMFEYGQAYVALSRATTLDGLQLLDFDPRVVRAHVKVKAFYAELEGRARSESAGPVLTVSRQGSAPIPTGGWISRSSSSPSSVTSSRLPPSSQELPSPGSRTRPSPSYSPTNHVRAHAATGAAAGGGAEKGGAGGGITPAVRQRIEENRRRALEKLAAKRRSTGRQTSSSPLEGSGKPGGDGT